MSALFKTIQLNTFTINRLVCQALEDFQKKKKNLQLNNSLAAFTHTFIIRIKKRKKVYACMRT